MGDLVVALRDLSCCGILRVCVHDGMVRTEIFVHERYTHPRFVHEQIHNWRHLPHLISSTIPSGTSKAEDQVEKRKTLLPSAHIPPTISFLSAIPVCTPTQGRPRSSRVGRHNLFTTTL